MGIFKKLFNAYCYMTDDVYRDLTLLEEVKKINNNQYIQNNIENNKQIENDGNKSIIGELSIVYDKEGLGTLNLQIFKMEFNNKEIDLNEILTDKDKKELSKLLSEMNNIIIGRINEVL